MAKQTFGDGVRRHGHQAQFEAIEHQAEKCGGKHGPATGRAKVPMSDAGDTVDIRSLPCQLQIILIGGG